jgi:ribosomal protein L37E
VTKVRCESCGHEADLPYSAALLRAVRQCERCGREALVVIEDPPREDED